MLVIIQTPGGGGGGPMGAGGHGTGGLQRIDGEVCVCVCGVLVMEGRGEWQPMCVLHGWHRILGDGVSFVTTKVFFFSPHVFSLAPQQVEKEERLLAAALAPYCAEAIRAG